MPPRINLSTHVRKKIEASLVSTELQTGTRAVSVMAIFMRKSYLFRLIDSRKNDISAAGKFLASNSGGTLCFHVFRRIWKKLVLVFFYLAPAEEERKKCILKMVHCGSMKEDVVALQKKTSARVHERSPVKRCQNTFLYRESPCLACLQTFFCLLFSSKRCLLLSS